VKSLQRSSIELRGNPERVLGCMFIPGEEEQVEVRSRISDVINRVLDLSEDEVHDTLRFVEQSFHGRHRDLTGLFQLHYKAVAHFIEQVASPEQQALIGAYFTKEYALEGAAYFNPSMVVAPSTPHADPGILRFILSVRAVGEGHISTIVFRSGSIGTDGEIHIDSPSRFASTQADRFTILRRELVRQAAIEAGVISTDLELALALLPDKFTPEELMANLTQLDLPGVRHSASNSLIETMDYISRSSYEVDFPIESDISERVLWPIAPDERRGMEDARFVCFTDDNEPVRYRASYTAYDGEHVSSRVLETDDFRTFSSMALTGKGVQNKGVAFFPRRIQGLRCALSRHDRESNSIAYSSDGYHWNDLQPLDAKKRPWELVHVGNCGSPIEIDEGWLVLTHGAGPVRQYSIGAMLLERDDPSRIIGQLPHPFLTPTEYERSGYVPNVVYSCGGLVHGETLVIPYGFSDWRIGFATVDVSELLEHMAT
jgi:predicted GH43/DUF377 family glycosyl hydrolase